MEPGVLFAFYLRVWSVRTPASDCQDRKEEPFKIVSIEARLNARLLHGRVLIGAKNTTPGTPINKQKTQRVG